LKSVFHDLVTATIPRANITTTWYDDKTDPEQVYPVDMMIVGKVMPLFVYEITSDRHCLTSAVSCLHHRLKQSAFIGIAIFDDEEAIPRIARIPLLQAVETRFSVRSQAPQIADFLLANSA
jgi:hypothetical protein